MQFKIKSLYFPYQFILQNNMAKRLSVYINDEQLEVLWDITWQDLVALAINGKSSVDATWRDEMFKTILEKLDWLWEKTTWPIKKSCFSDDTTLGVDNYLGLSEGQIRYWNDLLKQAVDGLNEKGFKWMYYYYESLGYNISWKLEEYVKDGLREAIGKRADIDYTLFKI